MVLIDASTRWSYICLLSTRNQLFAKLLVQLKAHFLDNLIKKICFDNTGEITCHAFHEYCISMGIEIEHLIVHVHTQNRQSIREQKSYLTLIVDFLTIFSLVSICPLLVLADWTLSGLPTERISTIKSTKALKSDEGLSCFLLELWIWWSCLRNLFENSHWTLR